MKHKQAQITSGDSGFKGRNESVSIAKGIAILLMVLAHSGFYRYGCLWINIFHMPLFFFFSGFCFKEKYLDNSKVYILKRIKALYVPFVKWNILFLLMHNIFYYVNIYNDKYGFGDITSHLYSLSEMLKVGLNIITKMNDSEQLLGGFWFLRCLFIGSLISFFLIKYVRNTKMGGGILIGLTILFSGIHKSLPYVGIGSMELLSSLFIYIGYIYKKKELKWHYCWQIVLVAVFLTAIMAKWWWACMLSFNYLQVIPYFLIASLGVLAVYYISSYIKKYNNVFVKFLIFAGNNSLTILIWHFLSFKLVSIVLLVKNGESIERLAEFPVIREMASDGWWCAYFIVGSVVPMLLAKIPFLRK